MTSVNENTDLRYLKKFIRCNMSMLHLDLSGMFKTAEQVQGIVKAIAKNDTLLALHLSNTPVIRREKILQSYIRKKLNMSKFLVKPKSNICCKEIVN